MPIKKLRVDIDLLFFIECQTWPPSWTNECL